ncbi:MAG: glutathione synthase [Gloeomargaritaceae cyanobacterium C42_A2020_066]|nr:glutathione synthase [Gloeomargaritaceae cyanobacterium C42_A2020_066]
MKFAFIIDPLPGLDPTHDSSVAMMEAAQVLGHEVWVTHATQLTVLEGETWAWLQPVRLQPVHLVEGRWQVESPWFSWTGPAVARPLREMQVVFMRKDPPVDTAYLWATYLLDAVNPAHTLVVNRPAGLRNTNEKLAILQFPHLTPKTLVTQDRHLIRQFLSENGPGVLKPIGGKAGEGILYLEPGDRNLNSLIEVSTQAGRLPVMIQVYLPAARRGDKRIILLDGTPIGAVNRVPSGHDFRGNMAVGGRVEACEITPREEEICLGLAPALRATGLFFVGIDVIGGYLTEINVTSPTGIREIDRLSGTQLGKTVIEWAAGRVAAGL